MYSSNAVGWYVCPDDKITTDNDIIVMERYLRLAGDIEKSQFRIGIVAINMHVTRQCTEVNL